jgi:hypothetical protein
MNTKSRVVEWLIDNDQILLDIQRDTGKQIENVEREFKDEARDQQLEEIRRRVIDMMSRDLGLTSGDLSEILDIESVKQYLEEV